MVRNFLASVVMLFLLQTIYSNLQIDKKWINGVQIVSQDEFFTPNQEVERLVSEDKKQKKASKKMRKSSHNDQEAQTILTDIPVCIDAYQKAIEHGGNEVRYEFFSHQSREQLQQLYITELTRLGWNIEVLSVLKELIILAQKPRKKMVVMIESIKGGWFSKNSCKVIIIIKEH